MSENECCEKCRFYVMRSCRRHAPRALILPALGRPYQSRNIPYAAAAWPDVHEDDWCGEFEGKGIVGKA